MIEAAGAPHGLAACWGGAAAAGAAWVGAPHGSAPKGSAWAGAAWAGALQSLTLQRVFALSLTSPGVEFGRWVLVLRLWRWLT